MDVISVTLYLPPPVVSFVRLISCCSGFVPVLKIYCVPSYFGLFLLVLGDNINGIC